MLPQIVFFALCLVHSAFALVLPSQAQVPILPSHHHSYAKPKHLGALIAYKRHGEEYEATIQIPLRQPLRGSLLHVNPVSGYHKSVHSMKIVAVVNMDTGASGSLEGLSRVRCSIQPRFSAGEVSATTASGGGMSAWPSFGVEDDVVVLDQSDSRWFLAGRSIESIECW